MSELPVGTANADVAEGPWVSYGRTAFALVVVLALAVLGVANIGLRARSHEVEDGVLWVARGEGVRALEVAPGSAAARSGILPGDVVVAVDGALIRIPSDVVELEHQSPGGAHLSYT